MKQHGYVAYRLESIGGDHTELRLQRSIPVLAPDGDAGAETNARRAALEALRKEINSYMLVALATLGHGPAAGPPLLAAGREHIDQVVQTWETLTVDPDPEPDPPP